MRLHERPKHRGTDPDCCEHEHTYTAPSQMEVVRLQPWTDSCEQARQETFVPQYKEKTCGAVTPGKYNLTGDWRTECGAPCIDAYDDTNLVFHPILLDVFVTPKALPQPFSLQPYHCFVHTNHQLLPVACCLLPVCIVFILTPTMRRCSCNNRSCDYPDELPSKVVSSSIRDYNPDAFLFLSKVELSTYDAMDWLGQVDLNATFNALHPDKNIAARTVVCDWIKENRETWERWLPDSHLNTVRL